MKYPEKERILKVLEKIEQKKILPTKLISSDASITDKMKFGICQKIIRYKRDADFSGKELAEILGVTPAVVSRILHCSIERFTIDTLLAYYEKLLFAKKDKKALKEFKKQLETFFTDQAA